MCFILFVYLDLVFCHYNLFLFEVSVPWLISYLRSVSLFDALNYHPLFL